MPELEFQVLFFLFLWGFEDCCFIVCVENRGKKSTLGTSDLETVGFHGQWWKLGTRGLMGSQ